MRKPLGDYQNLMRTVLILGLLTVLHVGLHAAPPHKYVRIITSKGECVLRLYDETPLHRDNFVKLVREGYYKDLLFHRVIQHFMIQGGDPDSRYAAEKQRLGNGGPDYRIPAEFRDSLFHKKGTIAAARDNNPEKSSSGSQFYLVQGSTFTDNVLDSLEQFGLSGRKIPAYQREAYKTIGGVPYLDQNYTVFGELIYGVAVIDSIAAVRKDRFDRPLEDQRMDMVLLTRREAINLEREQAGLTPKNTIFTKFFDLFKPKY